VYQSWGPSGLNNVLDCRFVEGCHANSRLITATIREDARRDEAPPSVLIYMLVMREAGPTTPKWELTTKVGDLHHIGHIREKCPPGVSVSINARMAVRLPGLWCAH
jgi:hypothetical protein